MRVLSLGSLNIDKVYSVDHIVNPKETIESTSYNNFCGGKGLNQSVALARAGADVSHAGMIGEDGTMLADALRESGVRMDLLRTVDGPSGHAVIQIDPHAQNCIIIFGGSNRRITPQYIDEVMEGFDAGDVLLLQNEISGNGYAIEKAHEARYRRLLENIREGIVFSREGDMIWECSNCGHIVIGPKAPEVCPVCDHAQSYFQLKAENY